MYTKNSISFLVMIPLVVSLISLVFSGCWGEKTSLVSAKIPRAVNATVAGNPTSVNFSVVQMPEPVVISQGAQAEFESGAVAITIPCDGSCPDLFYETKMIYANDLGAVWISPSSVSVQNQMALLEFGPIENGKDL